VTPAWTITRTYHPVPKRLTTEADRAARYIGPARLDVRPATTAPGTPWGELDERARREWTHAWRHYVTTHADGTIASWSWGTT
jgi:hypothetical protein